MILPDEELYELNEAVFSHLENILKQLNKRLHLKMYSLLISKNKSVEKITRLKKSVVDDQERYQVKTEPLPNDIGTLFLDLNIEAALPAPNDYIGSLKRIFERQEYKKPQFQTADSDEADCRQSEQAEQADNPQQDKRILYANAIPCIKGTSRFDLLFIADIRNLDRESRNLFYEQPYFSYVRMALDYFFTDYFMGDAEDRLLVDEDAPLSAKYHEDARLFNRRIARLFFGKMHNQLLFGELPDEIASRPDNYRSDYYVRNLLEQMDEIAGLTYEKANPFGSILLMPQEVIADPDFIPFSIRFRTEDRIMLDDAKRIRKLLELTNTDRELFLIGDYSSIYGLSEVNWSMQNKRLVLRVDFNGLSKFSLSRICTRPAPKRGGELLTEQGSRYFRSDLELVEDRLLALSSKNPRIGEEGYSSEKFTQLLEQTFWNGEADEQARSSIKALDELMEKARGQKHGTMVVITDSTTAEKELDTLSKQSTLVEPGRVQLEHIRFLTAIDGAIYLDKEAQCHAIGVILDGVAQKNLGDASRGARYNSAHRYLHKLQAKGHPCVIAIISEDGMVDLIPETENEEQLLTVAYEIIDSLNEQGEKTLDAADLAIKKGLLLQSRIIDSEWLFSVGRAYMDKKRYGEALEYYERALNRAGREYVSAGNYNSIGVCYFEVATENSDIAAVTHSIDMYRKSIEQSTTAYLSMVANRNLANSLFKLAKLQRSSDKEASVHTLDNAIAVMDAAMEIRLKHKFKYYQLYTLRGNCYIQRGFYEPEEPNKPLYYEKALQDHRQALEEQTPSEILHRNLSYAYELLKDYRSALTELLEAIRLRTEDAPESPEHDSYDYTKALKKLLKSDETLIPEAVEAYRNMPNAGGVPEFLDKLYQNYKVKAEMLGMTEAAPASESPGGDPPVK